MEQEQSDLFAENDFQGNNKNRNKLIPVWIKVFAWIFLVFGAITPIVLILGLAGFSFEVSIYGLQTNDPTSLIGLLIAFVCMFKGLTAYSLLWKRDYAIVLGIADAIIGIGICVFVMVYPLIVSNTGRNFTLRLELALLIPYLLKMQKIKPEWS